MSARAEESPHWGRRRLLAVVVTVVLVVASGLVGLLYAVQGAIEVGRALDHAAVTGATLPGPPARRDTIAAAPMLRVEPQDSRDGAPAPSPAPAIVVPGATSLGPAGVPTGFDHTPEGAVGQLAAIATTVLQGMSIQQTRAVYEQWAAPGAPVVEEWSLMVAVRAFLASGAGRHVDEPGTAVVTVPVAAQVKGSDGNDWVAACVLLDVRVTVVTQARAAYGHCERLQWTDDRWVIAPGKVPAIAPSTWPGTDLASGAGWRTWTTGPGA